MAGSKIEQSAYAGAHYCKGTITALAGGAAPTLEANTLSGRYNTVTVCATTGDSVILPAGMGQGAKVTVVNNVATVTVDVYPPTGGTINGGTATTGQRGVATQTGATFICTSTDGLTWIADNTIAAAS
jgi:hypothetical protein